MSVEPLLSLLVEGGKEIWILEISHEKGQQLNVNLSHSLKISTNKACFSYPYSSLKHHFEQ